MKNEYCVTRKMYLSWTLESMGQKKKLIFLAICIVLSAVLFYFGFANGFNPIFVILGVLCLYQALLNDLVLAGKKYKKLTQTYGQKNWTRVIEFGDEQISVSEGTVSVQLDYSDMDDIWEKKDKILLIFNGKTVVRLYRDAFVDTDWEACREKIEQAQAAARERAEAAADEPEDE